MDEEAAQLHLLEPRFGEAGEAAVAVDEALQGGAGLVDVVEQLGGALGVAQLGVAVGRAHQGAHRGQVGAHLVADHPDRRLPARHLLAAQLGGQPAQHDQRLAPAVELEAALGDLEGFLALGEGHRRQAVALPLERRAEVGGQGADDVGPGMPLEAVAAAQEDAGGAIRVEHSRRFAHQHHRRRRHFEGARDEQLALAQRAALDGQGVADRVVAPHQVAEDVLVGDHQAQAEVAGVETLDAVGEGAG